MYCRNCGKEVEGDREYCLECEKERLIFGTMPTPPNSGEILAQTNVPAVVQPVKKGYSPKIIFLRALFSTISGFLSFILGICAYVTSVVPAIVDTPFSVADYSRSGSLNFKATTSTRVLFILAVIFLVFALIWGIKSIVTFAKAGKLNIKRSASTLVLGIVGVYFSIMSASILYTSTVMIFLGKFTYLFEFLN